MVKNIIQIQSGIMIKVDVNVKNIIYMKKILFGILLHVVAKMVNIYQFYKILLQKDKYQQLHYTFFKSCSNWGQIVILNNYQQLYHIFFDSRKAGIKPNIPPFTGITLFFLYQPGTYIIKNGNFLTIFLQIFLV